MKKIIMTVLIVFIVIVGYCELETGYFRLFGIAKINDFIQDIKYHLSVKSVSLGNIYKMNVPKKWVEEKAANSLTVKSPDGLILIDSSADLKKYTSLEEFANFRLAEFQKNFKKFENH